MARFGLKNQLLRSQPQARQKVVHKAAPLRRLAWTLIALLAISARASFASAHGVPGVSGMLDQSAGGVRVLRLYQGLVMKEGSSWRYVCSKMYNGAGQDIAGSLPGGGVAIAIPSGIALMKSDGTFMPHPDPEAAQAAPTAFARGADKLYALRFRDRVLASDVIEITPTTVKILWTDTHYWSDIAVGENSLALVRADQDEIDAMRLSFSGEVLSEDKATLSDTYAVSVRVMGDVPYYSVRLQNESVMGRIEQGMWKQVLMSGNAMAGPLVMQDGTTLVALDGVLSTFANEMATPLAENVDFVTALAELDGRPYACTATGLRDLNSAGLGDRLFDMSELLGPDECLLPLEMRADCELEWQHTQIELLGANIELPMGDTSESVCDQPAAGGTIAAGSGSAGAAGAGATAANATEAATRAAGAAGSKAAEAAMQSPAGAGTTAGVGAATAPPAPTSGCACGMLPRSPRGAAVTYSLLITSAWFLRRRRKFLC
jgi:hypothetical protein